MRTAAPPPAPAATATTTGAADFDCELDDNDTFPRHLVCAGRTSCAFAAQVDLDAERLLPEFWRADDRTERLWLAEKERRSVGGLTEQALALALDQYRTSRALDLRNDRERTGRVAQLMLEAERCDVCRQTPRVGVNRQPAPPDLDDDETVAVLPIRDTGGNVLGSRRVRRHKRTSITRLPSFRPMPDFVKRFTGLDGKQRQLVACPTCQSVLELELNRARAGDRVTPDGPTFAEAARRALAVPA